LQLGLEPARRLEPEAAGAGPGDGRTSDAIARQQLARPASLVDRLTPRRLCRKNKTCSDKLLLANRSRVIAAPAAGGVAKRPSSTLSTAWSLRLPFNASMISSLP
jgi:hypothetical protein